MNSHDDLAADIAMDDDDVEETMTRFRAGLARADADPAEAARIRVLADQADLDLLVGKQADDEDPAAGMIRIREAMAAADQASELVSREQGLEADEEAGTARSPEVGAGPGWRYRRNDYETLKRTHSLLVLERAEFDAAQIRSKAELELVDARHQAELELLVARHQAELADQQTKLDKRRDQAAEPHDRERRRPGLWGWMHGIITAPILTLVLLTVVGSTAALYKSVPLVSAVFAGAAAFIAFIYGTATFLSVLQLTFSKSPERRAGGQAALRLLLGHEEAIERREDEETRNLVLREADRMLMNARRQAEQITGDARTRAESLERDARERPGQAMGSLVQAREDLEESEREYRRLKAQVEGQLRNLEAGVTDSDST